MHCVIVSAQANDGWVALKFEGGKWIWQGNGFEEKLDSGHWASAPTAGHECATMRNVAGKLKFKSTDCGSIPGLVYCELRF